MGSDREKDGLDRLFEVIEAMQGTVKMIAADTEGTREAVGVIRERMTGFESRLEVLERAENRHLEWRRNANETDEKFASDQKAFVIALEETRQHAKEAVELARATATDLHAAIESSKQAYDAARLAFEASRRGLTTLATVKSTQESTARTLDDLKTEEQRKPKVPVALAAVLNLSVGLVYVILELLRRAGH